MEGGEARDIMGVGSQKGSSIPVLSGACHFHKAFLKGITSMQCGHSVKSAGVERYPYLAAAIVKIVRFEQEKLPYENWELNLNLSAYYLL